MAETAYCVKCRAKREMANARRGADKKGKPRLEGVCAVCGTKLFRYVKAK